MPTRSNGLLLRIACKKSGLLFRLRVIRNKSPLRTGHHSMSFRFLPDDASAAIRMPAGRTVLIDPSLRPGGSCLEVIDGVARVLSLIHI